MTRTAPGFLLGLCVVAGTVLAAFAVRPDSGRTLLPAPVLCYLAAALSSGIVHNRSSGSASTALFIGAAQWIADGFFAMALASLLAIMLTSIRWYAWHRARRAARGAGGGPQASRAAPAGSGYPAAVADLNSRRSGRDAGRDDPEDGSRRGDWDDPGSRRAGHRSPRPRRTGPRAGPGS
jgi:hypothetical protein